MLSCTLQNKVRGADDELGRTTSPTWTEFNINSIFGAQTCGNIDTQGLTQLCDICKHVKFNPIGSNLPKKLLNKPQMLKTRVGEEIQVTSKSFVIPDRCGKCLAEKRPEIHHPCTDSARKQNIIGLLGEAGADCQKAILGTAISTITRKECQDKLTL